MNSRRVTKSTVWHIQYNDIPITFDDIEASFKTNFYYDQANNYTRFPDWELTYQLTNGLYYNWLTSNMEPCDQSGVLIIYKSRPTIKVNVITMERMTSYCSSILVNDVLIDYRSPQLNYRTIYNGSNFSTNFIGDDDVTELIQITSEDVLSYWNLVKSSYEKIHLIPSVNQVNDIVSPTAYLSLILSVNMYYYKFITKLIKYMSGDKMAIDRDKLINDDVEQDNNDVMN